MTKDIGKLLDEWPYDANQVSARWMVDNQGERKVQLRVDMALSEMSTSGRPDGTRPNGYESLSAYYHEKETDLGEDARLLHLDPEECNALQQESMQYYYRYLAFYALRHLEGVIADTRHNLDLLDMVARCVADEETVWSFIQYFPYIRMMHSRAVCEQLMEQEHYDQALSIVNDALSSIRDFYAKHGDEDSVGESDEIDALESLKDRIEKARPRSAEEELQVELDQAIRREEYERAAELRDALKTIAAGSGD